MRIAHDSEVPYEKPGTRHRDGEISFKHLLRGEAGSPQNYEFMLADSGAGFPSPPHHHNFDQIRFCLRGAFGDGKGADLQAGHVGYYPEGAWYSIDSQDSEVVLLQFGGASGSGFTHFPQLFQAYAEMSKLGEFRDGRFHRHDTTNKAPDSKMTQDGYEALWQHIYGRPVVYPTPRYSRPILMDPEGYAWVPDPAQRGVEHKLLGVFTERAIEIGQVSVGAKAQWAPPAPPAPLLIYVLEGQGRGGGSDWLRGSAIEIAAGESLTLQAEESMLLLTMRLPTFSAEEILALRPSKAA